MTAIMRPRGIVSVQANGTPNIAAAIADLNNGFNDFKSGYGKRFDDLDARMDELERLGGRLGTGGGAPVRVDAKAMAEFFSAVRRRDVAPGEVTGENLEEYSAAFDTFLRRGDASPAEVKAAMQVGSDPDGGYFVKPALSNMIKQRLFDTSPIRSVASVMTITTDSIKFPLDINDATSGGWIGETESRPETDTADVGEQEIFVREQYAMPKTTQKLLDMASFDVDSWLTGKITRKLGRTENTAFVSGTGVKQPRGFLDYKSTAVTTDDASRAWGLLQYVPTGASGGFPALSGVPSASDPDCLVTLVHKLKAEYRQNAVWMMNRATAGTVRKLKDGDGRYIWQDSLILGQPDRLLGYPVIEAEDMPDIGSDSFSIAFGDFGSGYLIVDGPGVRILRDPYTSKGWVKFYTTKWTGGDVTDFDAIKLLKFGTS